MFYITQIRHDAQPVLSLMLWKAHEAFGSQAVDLVVGDSGFAKWHPDLVAEFGSIDESGKVHFDRDTLLPEDVVLQIAELDVCEYDFFQEQTSRKISSGVCGEMFMCEIRYCDATSFNVGSFRAVPSTAHAFCGRRNEKSVVRFGAILHVRDCRRVPILRRASPSHTISAGHFHHQSIFEIDQYLSMAIKN